MLTKLKDKKGVALAVTSILLVWMFLMLSTLVNYTINNSNKTNLYTIILNNKIEIDQIGTDFVNKTDFKNYYLLELQYSQSEENINTIFSNKYVLTINSSANTLYIKNGNQVDLLTVILKQQGETFVIKSWKYNASTL